MELPRIESSGKEKQRASPLLYICLWQETMRRLQKPQGYKEQEAANG